MILITKQTEWCEYAGRIARLAFPGLMWIKGNVGDPMPEIPDGDIISFLCPWVIPAHILEGRTAVNFHPGSSEYPGSGCYNFALHEESPLYGAVCHFMAPQVDAGAIIREVLFPIFPNDTVETLKFRTMVEMLSMFHLIIWRLSMGKAVVPGKVKWTRPAFTRKQLDQLYKDFPNTRATIYPDQQ